MSSPPQGESPFSLAAEILTIRCIVQASSRFSDEPSFRAIAVCEAGQYGVQFSCDVRQSEALLEL
jgi:hypothetical protein